MTTIDLTPRNLRPGDRLPEFGGTIDHTTIRPSGTVEVRFTDPTVTPLGFRPEYPFKIKTERH